MRRLLLLAYHFPLSNEVAGKVTARLVRHLPAVGWEPHVIAAATDRRTILDPDGYADVQRTTAIDRVRCWPMPLDAVPHLARWRKQPTASWNNAPTTARRSALRELLGYPDLQAGWIVPAYRRATELLRQRRVDAVLTVCPPVSAHLAGWLLKRRFRRVPWVAQFHDPWANNPFHDRRIARLTACDTEIETAVLARCDHALYATDEAAAAVAEPFRGKTSVLVNGFDPQDFPATSDRPRNDDRFVIAYAGSLYGSRDPLPILKALARTIAVGRLPRNQLRILFVGDCVSVAPMVAQLELTDIVELRPPVPYPESLALLAQADLLLLLAEGQPAQIPAKLFEYLYLNRPILALATGATARVLRDYPTARVTTGDNTIAIESALVEAYANRHAGTTPASDSSPYNASNLAGQLAAILNRLVATTKARRNV